MTAVARHTVLVMAALAICATTAARPRPRLADLATPSPGPSTLASPMHPPQPRLHLVT